MITVIDYGLGNIGSIENMLKKIGAAVKVTSKIEEIEKAEKLILPGVGAFDSGMRNLEENGLIPVLNRKVIEQKTPILGICLGFQLFTKESEEGSLKGLGWLNARTVKFKFEGVDVRTKIPHIGWNPVYIKKASPLFDNMPDDPRFCFVHSYHVVCDEKDDILTETDYVYNFVSSAQKNNIFGVQFHPEKSHKFGMSLLKNYMGI